MKYIPHPEWTEKYPAIDGIPKPKRTVSESQVISNELKVLYSENPIRSDIEEILKLDETNFMIWYQTKNETTTRLLKDYKIFADISDLSDGSEKLKLTMGSSVTIYHIVKNLEKGLEYLSIIKQAKEEILGKKLDELKNEF